MLENILISRIRFIYLTTHKVRPAAMLK